MSEPYVGEIRMFAGSFYPAGWEFCNGQLLPISEYETLFNLIGTTYGGDGESTFALPNLCGRVPLCMGTGLSGTNYQLAEMAGTESVTLTMQQIPTHNHALMASADFAQESNPQDKVLARLAGKDVYSKGGPDGNMNAAQIGPVGGSQPHENMQPYLCINFIISMFGIFPTQS